MEPAILDAMDNYDMVLFYTGEQLEIIKRYAADYADVKFVGFDIDPDIEPEFPNIFCMTYAQNEGEFLAGALAAKMSKSGTVGFVTGTESPVINDFMVGYIEGAQHVKSDIKVAISYSGDFTNTTKAKEVALLQIQQNGADVIHQVAAGAGLGIAVDIGGLFPQGWGCLRRWYSTRGSGPSAWTPTRETSLWTPSRRWPTSSSPR